MTSSLALPAPVDKCAFFLDVDGTLIDIAETPDGVVVPPELPAILSALAKRAGGAVALVSGRTIEALDRLVAPARLPAAGVHGAEMRFADGTRASLDAEGMDAVRAGLAELTARHPDLLVEDKGPAIAVHYRARPALGPEVEIALRASIAGNEKLHLQPGKMVLEVRPAGADKGRALARFMETPPFSGRSPVAIGDDLTDEHMFQVAREMGGLAGNVGAQKRKTAATVRLASPDSVRKWLQSLTSTPSRG